MILILDKQLKQSIWPQETWTETGVLCSCLLGVTSDPQINVRTKPLINGKGGLTDN